MRNPITHGTTLREREPPELVSLVTTAWNEEQILETFCDTVGAVLGETGLDYEIVVVDNGSTDGSLELIKSLQNRNSRIEYVSLSRNFGHQAGLIAGMEAARGDIVITMDADLQHPPGKLPEMIALWRQGHDIVNTRKMPGSRTPISRRLSDRLFYWFLSVLCNIPFSESQSDFRLLGRNALNALLSLPEREKFLRGLVHWIGFPATNIEYEVRDRQAGHTKFKFNQLVVFGLGGVTSFTVLPLRIFTLFGLLVSGVSIAYGGYILFEINFAPAMDAPPGWATLATAMFFLSGTILAGIGILGEYIGRVLDETRNRPTFIVRETSLNNKSDR